MVKSDSADFVFVNHRIVWTCQPTSQAAREHLTARAADGLWVHGALAVQPQDVLDLATALEDDGFTTEV